MKGEGLFVEMWMPNKSGDQSPSVGDEPLINTRPDLRGAFADVYRFILQAVNGDRATADTLFEDYLDGKLSEPLLSISRGCVSADQAGSSNRNGEEFQRIAENADLARDTAQALVTVADHRAASVEQLATSETVSVDP